MTLRARLTVWYAAVLTAILFLFGSAVYLMLVFSLTRQVEETLERIADDILRATQVEIVGVPLSTFQLELGLTANVYVQLLDVEKQVVRSSPSSPAIARPLDPAALGEYVRAFSSVEVDSEHLRVLTVPVRRAGGDDVIGYVQLAASLETVDQAKDMLLFVLVGGGLLAVAVATLLGWSTVGAALRPLNQVTEAALQITRADDLSRRIPIPGPPRDELGRLIVAFNDTLERLENLFESQRRFLADVSHELRTPLTAIRGNLDLMRRMGQIDPDSLDAMNAEVDRMTRMVRDLLLLAQAETGKLPLAQDEVELDTLMLDVYQEARVLAPQGVRVRIGNEDQARVIGDRDRLKQVLLNLIANALEFTPQGGDVTLGLNCVGDHARMTVSDTGPGIAKEELPHIFERFYRIDPARKRNMRGGAGLGLSIAYWITRSHQGRLEVASEVGRGTTFSVWLPLVDDSCGKASAVS